MMRIVHIPTADIFVPAGRRPIDLEKVKQLADSIAKVGLLQPITVNYEGGRIRLVAGAHRVAAVKRLGWREIQAVTLLGNDVQLRLAEIAENLHRNELTALERDDLLAEWIRLTEADLQSSQLETIESRRPDGRGHRHEGGVSAAARELGISKADAHRAVKVAALSPEAKAVATEVGLADNRSALLAAAKTELEKQVETLRKCASRKASETPTENPIAVAWNRANQRQRREFALAYRIELLRAQQAGGMAGPSADRAEAERLAAEQAAVSHPLDIPPELRRTAP